MCSRLPIQLLSSCVRSPSSVPQIEHAKTLGSLVLGAMGGKQKAFKNILDNRTPIFDPYEECQQLLVNKMGIKYRSLYLNPAISNRYALENEFPPDIEPRL